MNYFCVYIKLNIYLLNKWNCSGVDLQTYDLKGYWNINKANVEIRQEYKKGLKYKYI